MGKSIFDKRVKKFKGALNQAQDQSAGSEHPGKKVALITGVAGQDGAYLSEFLLEKGYIVHGLKRRASQFNTDRVDHLYQAPHEEERNFILHYGDMTDGTNLIRLIQEIQPDEVYNLAAMSHVRVTFEIPQYTGNADGISPLLFLDWDTSKPDGTPRKVMDSYRFKSNGWRPEIEMKAGIESTNENYKTYMLSGLTLQD